MRSYLKPDPAFYGMPFESDSFNSMPYLYLGRTGCRVSKVGLGTFKFGHPETGDGSFVDQKAAFKMLDRAVELGVTFWDTANRYNASSGNSERVLGQWFRANPEIRRDIVIATKLFGLMDGRTPNHCRLGRINIMEAVHASLERLQCDHIDILFFHLFDPLTPIEESLEAVQELIRRDLIRYLGVHNFTVEQLETYENYALQGYPSIAAVENIYNVLEGDEIVKSPDVLKYCARSGKSYIGWGPLAHGIVSNWYLDLGKLDETDRLARSEIFKAKMVPANREKLRQLADLGRDEGLEINQLALAWMLTRPGMGPVIPAAYTVEQLESNAMAGALELSEEQAGRVARILS